MAECIVLKGGGGADLDVVTAGKPDVLAGKVIVDKDGEPLTGTMPNRGAVSATLNAGGSYTIPAGYHNGSGKIVANSLASQTPGNADRGSILEGRSAWVNGAKVDGSIPWQNVEIAGTDRAWSQGMSNWAGTINLKVRNGHYLSGVNWIQQNIPEYQPWNIKKGVNIGGIVGTWEGYVPVAQDLYYRGNNPAGFKGGGTYEAGQISISGYSEIYSTEAVNFVGKSFINIELYVSAVSDGGWVNFRMYDSGDGGGIQYFSQDSYPAIPSTFTASFSVASIQINKRIKLVINNPKRGSAIYRIWLS